VKRRQRASGPDPERFPTIRYDLLKELSVALGITSVIVVALAALLSSPDVQPDTIQRWALTDPVDFVTTATSELAGTSASAQYGPPYNHGTESIQRLGPLAPQEWAGVHQPVDAANRFVLDPLAKASAGDARLAAALATFNAASAGERNGWLDAYISALGKAKARPDGTVAVGGRCALVEVRHFGI